MPCYLHADHRAILQFRENLKVNLEKAIDDFIDKGLTEVEILGENASAGEFSQEDGAERPKNRDKNFFA